MPRRDANAFTLIETVLSLAIAALLMGALASLMALTSRALPSGSSADEAAAAQRQRLIELADELSTAYEVESSGNRHRIRVADRTGDGVDDTIEYQWSGVEGEPLVRRIGTSSGTFIEGVAAFSIDYASATRDATTSVIRTESNMTLADQPASPKDSLQVRPGTSVAFLLRPVLASSITQWRPDRVTFHAAVSALSSGDVLVVVCPANASGLPDESAPLGSVRVVVPSLQLSQSSVIADLPVIAWQNVGTPLWVVLRSNNASTRLLLGVTTPMPAETAVATSAGTWTIDHEAAPRYTLVGCVRGTFDTATSRNVAPRATISLRTQVLPQTTLGVRLLNEPLRP